MSKLLVTANSLEHLNKLLDMNIDGVIIGIEKLSVNSSCYFNIDDVINMDFKDKEVFISLNKIMHNSDLDILRNTIKKLSKKEYKIMFYDLAVYNIAKENNMLDRLVIYQDHLNASINSNDFWYNMGVNYSYVTNDITYEELIEIKKNTKMKIMFLVYGYTPIFYSRRYLINNYLKYVGKEKKNLQYKIISDDDKKYIIDEEDYGTTIYTSEVINLINYLSELNDIDYLVLNSNKIDDDEFNAMVDNYLNGKKLDNTYVGFFNTKTIYRVK